MSICNINNVVLSSSIDCAVICDGVSLNYELDYDVDEFTAISNLDGLDPSLFLHKWNVINNGNIIYTTGYGEYNNIIPLFINSSTFSTIYLGEDNQDILDFLRNIGFFVKSNMFSLEYEVKLKSNGITKKINKYSFYERF
jgi:hypothetical protein